MDPVYPLAAGSRFRTVTESCISPEVRREDSPTKQRSYPGTPRHGTDYLRIELDRKPRFCDVDRIDPNIGKP